MAEQLYVALIGDLVASREQPDRAAVQERLLAAVAAVRPRVLWAAPLGVTAGDEVQALLTAERAETAVAAVTALSEGLVDPDGDPRTSVGTPVRFGLGFGALTTRHDTADDLAETSPALLDGPCFHHARGALERARAEHRWVCVRGADGDPDASEAKSLDALFALMGVVRAGWTATQVRYVTAWREELHRRVVESVEPKRRGGPPVVFVGDMRRDVLAKLARGLRSRVAEATDKSPSVITQAFQSASLDEILDGEEAARLLLRRMGGRAVEMRDVLDGGDDRR